jgi:hypothetical protein
LFAQVGDYTGVHESRGRHIRFPRCSKLSHTVKKTAADIRALFTSYPPLTCQLYHKRFVVSTPFFVQNFSVAVVHWGKQPLPQILHRARDWKDAVAATPRSGGAGAKAKSCKARFFAA